MAPLRTSLILTLTLVAAPLARAGDEPVSLLST